MLIYQQTVTENITVPCQHLKALVQQRSAAGQTLVRSLDLYFLFYFLFYLIKMNGHSYGHCTYIAGREHGRILHEKYSVIIYDKYKSKVTRIERKK